MRQLDHPGKRLPLWKRRRLTLLIGSAVAAWVGVARGQADGQPAGDVPVLLRPTMALSLKEAQQPPAVPVPTTMAGLRIDRQLSPAATPRSLAEPPGASPPMLLRAALALARPTKPAARGADTVAASSGLRLAGQLSSVTAPATSPAPAASAPAAYASAPAAFAAARAAQPEAPVDPETVRPGPPASPSAGTPTPSGGLPDLEAVTWAIPPIRWSGNTGSTYVYNTNFLGQTSLSDTQLLSGRASSFIYAPWFAQVTTTAGLSTSGATYHSTDSTSKSDSTSLNFGGNLSLFPLSRFPFSAYVEVSDSRARATGGGDSAMAASTQYDAVRVGARQNYRPETGNENYNGSVDHSSLTSGGLSSIVNAFQGGYSTSFEDHGISASTRFSSTTGDAGGQGSTLFSATGSHNWQIPEEGLTISTSANFSRNDLKTLSTTGSGLVVNNSQVMQASSSFNWLPDEELPLTIAGGAGILNLATSTESANTSLMNLNSFVNASYRITNNLMASAGGTIATTSTTNTGLTPAAQNDAGTSAGTATRLLTTSQNASISYMGDPLVFGDYSYNWGGGANLSNQTNSLGGNSRALGTSAQHSLNTTFPLSDTSVLALNASQSVSLNAAGTTSTNSGTTNSSNQNTTLTHSAGAVWRANVGQVSIATMSFNASDTMSTGAFSNHLRSFHADGRLQTQLSTRAALNASTTVSASQQLSSPQTFTTTTTALGTTSTTMPSTVWSGNGQIFFTYRSPFDIANLLYTASFSANANQSNLRVISGDPNAVSWQIARVLSNQASYRVGRLVFQATASMAWLGDGKKNATLFGSINREIGDF